MREERKLGGLDIFEETILTSHPKTVEAGFVRNEMIWMSQSKGGKGQVNRARSHAATLKEEEMKTREEGL